MEAQTILGIKVYPQDNVWDYKDYRDDRHWQLILKMARKRNIKVIVREFSEGLSNSVLGFYSSNEGVDVIVINNKIPNYYKPKVLAHELAKIIVYKKEEAHSQLDIYMEDTKQLFKEYLYKNYFESIIEAKIERFADRIYKMVTLKVKREMKDFKSERLPNGQWKLFGKVYKN